MLTGPRRLRKIKDVTIQLSTPIFKQTLRGIFKQNSIFKTKDPINKGAMLDIMEFYI